MSSMQKKIEEIIKKHWVHWDPNKSFQENFKKGKVGHSLQMIGEINHQFNAEVVYHELRNMVTMEDVVNHVAGKVGKVEVKYG